MNHTSLSNVNVESLLGSIFSTPAIRYVSGFRKLLETGLSCVLHAHPGFEIVYHPSGVGETCINNDEVISFGPGSIVIYPPNVLHIQTLTEPGEDVCLLFVPQTIIPQTLLEVRYLPAPPSTAIAYDLLALADESLPLIPERQQELDFRMTTVVYTLWQAALTHRSGSTASHRHPYVDAARRYMQSNYGHIHRVSEVADYVGVSEVHLRHLFRAECGISMREWLNIVRIERAKELLTHFSLPLPGIAELCGFANERYFSTVFSRIAGCAPGAFRKRVIHD